MVKAFDTLPNDAAAEARSRAADGEDRTRQLARLIRHAMKSKTATSPLDRAIRSLAAGADGGPTVNSLAERLNDLLARRAAAVRPHLETVCG